MKCSLIFVLCTLLVLKGISQTLDDPVYLNYTRIPSTGFQDSDGETSFDHLETNLAFPLNLSKNVRLINAVYYRFSDFNFSSSASLYSNRLHDIRYSAIVQANLSERVDLISIARIMIRSDLNQDLQTNDLFPFGLLLANYKINSPHDFKVGLGVALVNDFNHNTIIPIASVRYESTRVKLEVVYPNINLLYKKSESFEFGLFGTVEGSISRTSMTGPNDLAMFQRNVQILIAPTASHRIYKQFFGHVKVGIAPLTQFQLLDETYEKIEGTTERLDTSLFVRTGISFRINE